ncbi:MAG: glycerol-3-phosphate dehydrogenase/oxidase [Flammeovirgaceae bacterium]|nr:glycerol-3-phosphate dehydrogenase/oxidase [Flammeovirgaceae bacterium]
MSQFSFYYRKEIIEKLKSDQFDVLIIGGGITGAGIALDAASRGLKTALVEKNDFASGTSSRSTKLIHGGLRYLKQFEFGLVKEVGSERAIVHNLAPHLVIPEKMLLPLYEKRVFGYLLTSFGLKIYDWLAGVSWRDQRRMLTRSRTLKREPLLRKDDIKGGALYAEYRTDDARLTIEIAKTAAANGATLLNYLAVTEFIYKDNKVTGVIVNDAITHETFSIKSNAVINAAGPWVDELREVNRSKVGKRLHLTKGVHIVFPLEKVPIKQAIYFDVEDGRMIFAIPRGRTTYVGTTDTTYHESKEEVFASKEDVEYLTKAVNYTFPSVNLQIGDVESSWAGLRPLIHEDGKSASELSRKDEIFVSKTGLISIAGGKLTGYRKMAERVLDLVVENYFAKKNFKKCFTDKIKLTGADFKKYKDVEVYEIEIAKQLEGQNLDPTKASYLVSLYGRQTSAILEKTREPTTDAPSLRLLKAECSFCIENEMVVTLEDFFVRRTGQLFFDIKIVNRYKSEIANLFKSNLSWDSERLDSELNSLNKLIFRSAQFD